MTGRTARIRQKIDDLELGDGWSDLNMLSDALRAVLNELAELDVEDRISPAVADRIEGVIARELLLDNSS